MDNNRHRVALSVYSISKTVLGVRCRAPRIRLRASNALATIEVRWHFCLARTRFLFFLKDEASQLQIVGTTPCFGKYHGFVYMGHGVSIGLPIQSTQKPSFSFFFGGGVV